MATQKKTLSWGQFAQTFGPSAGPPDALPLSPRERREILSADMVCRGFSISHFGTRQLKFSSLSLFQAELVTTIEDRRVLVISTAEGLLGVISTSAVLAQTKPVLLHAPMHKIIGEIILPAVLRVRL